MLLAELAVDEVPLVAVVVAMPFAWQQPLVAVVVARLLAVVAVAPLAVAVEAVVAVAAVGVPPVVANRENKWLEKTNSKCISLKIST